MFFDLGIIDGCSIFLCVISYQFREGFKKKSGIFQIWSESPTHPCNSRKSGEKNKIFIVLK